MSWGIHDADSQWTFNYVNHQIEEVINMNDVSNSSTSVVIKITIHFHLYPTTNVWDIYYGIVYLMLI